MGWFIHLGVFILVQCFFLLSDKWNFWNYIFLNNIGEKTVVYMHKFLGENLIYQTDILNVITILWGIALIGSTGVFVSKKYKR